MENCVLDMLDASSELLARLYHAAIAEADPLTIGQAVAALRALGLDEAGVASYLYPAAAAD